MDKLQRQLAKAIGQRVDDRLGVCGEDPLAKSQQRAFGANVMRTISKDLDFRCHLLWLVAFGILFQSCRITDHSERDPDDVSSGTLNFPASGYENVDPKDLPKMEFEFTHLDFGKIAQGEKVDSIYTFVNTGGGPLLITDVRGSCGCTVGKDWPKHPVKPNERATISVSFDSEGRNGRQDKTVTVVANTSPPSNVLTLTAEVIGPTTP